MILLLQILVWSAFCGDESQPQNESELKSVLLKVLQSSLTDDEKVDLWIDKMQNRVRTLEKENTRISNQEKSRFNNMKSFFEAENFKLQGKFASHMRSLEMENARITEKFNQMKSFFEEENFRLLKKVKSLEIEVYTRQLSDFQKTERTFFDSINKLAGMCQQPEYYTKIGYHVFCNHMAQSHALLSEIANLHLQIERLREERSSQESLQSDRIRCLEEENFQLQEQIEQLHQKEIQLQGKIEHLEYCIAEEQKFSQWSANQIAERNGYQYQFAQQQGWFKESQEVKSGQLDEELDPSRARSDSSSTYVAWPEYPHQPLYQ